LRRFLAVAEKVLIVHEDAEFVARIKVALAAVASDIQVANALSAIRAEGMLAQEKPDVLVVDAGLADRIGATLVAGTPENLKVLREMGLPVSAKRVLEAREAKNAGLPADVSLWIMEGERGLSSNAMCKAIHGIPADAGVDHPHDPDDFRRCVLFLDATGSRPMLPLLREVSPAWAALVDAWDNIEAAFAEERNGKTAPKTYELMKTVLESHAP